MPPKKARIKDIALLAGVSIGTVDRVLHNRGEVASKTVARVMNIAKELDYSPNLLAQALKTSKHFNLVSLLPEPAEDTSFWEKHPLGIRRAMKELDPFPVVLTEICFNLYDEKDFQEKAQEVIKLKPDGVILAPIFKTESTTFCNNLSSAGIPFVFVDGFLKEVTFLSYTGEDIFQSGRVAGQLTDLVTPPDKDILVVNIARNLQNVHHLNSRTKGFLSYFQKQVTNGGKRINLSIADPGKEEIKKEIGKVFIKNNDIASVFISGSKSYKVADYFVTEGINAINIIGYDLLDQNVEHLKKGTIKFLLGQRPEEQTYRGIRKLFDFLSINRIPEKMEYLPVDVVTSENVKFFL